MTESSSTIKKIIKETVVSSTSHGLPNIAQSETLILKIFWIIVTLLSSGFCALYIVLNVISFYQYEVTTRTRIRYDLDTIFPSVTFCSDNYFPSEYGQTFEKEKLNEYNTLKDQIYYKPHYPIQAALKFSKNLTIFKKFGYSLKELVEYADFNFVYVNYETSFKHVLLPRFGNCFTFNPGFYENGTNRDPSRSFKAGYESGFKLYSKTSSYGSSGVVYVHDFGSSPLTTYPIFVHPGQVTNIILKRTKMTQIPKPYSKCDPDTDDPNKYNSDLFKFLHNSKFKYSQKLCLDLCFHEFLLKNCSCYFFYLTQFANGNPCLTESGYECNIKFWQIFTERDYLNKFCLPRCPLECESMSFISLTSIELAGYTSPVIRVYFEDFGVTEIEENEAMDSVTLISNIGGILGLFLGVSFLSFFEIFALILKCLLESFKNQIKETS
ncbi:unnamed protein product [Brachionus calyciflorus]|uniref:Uncharacterized protein n=1 Tax=Brachionus calyciflorus TaxID=104777 RepID=A0A814GNY2_9BILA|nr:unnamed protein product [Brachionus calyciflorus]